MDLVASAEAHTAAPRKREELTVAESRKRINEAVVRSVKGIANLRTELAEPIDQPGDNFGIRIV
jgi:hypothetical protein